MIMVVWVDEISTAYLKYHRDCTAEYEAFRSKFRAEFQLKEMGHVRDYLGMEVSRNREENTLSFNCSDNINQILKQFEMEYCEVRHTPMAAGTQIGAREI
jgi:hypothetical protein